MPAKQKLTPDTYLYPMPTVIVGANVEGKPNFMTVSYCGVVQHRPPLIAVGCARGHFTNRGIHENRCFSINIPSADLVRQTDYVGIVSGKKEDTSAVFQSVNGSLGAPMISECPLSMECRLAHVLDLGGTSEIFIGEIVEAHAADRCLTNGLPDLAKLHPILFSMHDNTYWSVGAQIGKAWSIGRDYRPE